MLFYATFQEVFSSVCCFLLLCKQQGAILHETQAGEVELLMIAYQRLTVDRHNISKMNVKINNQVFRIYAIHHNKKTNTGLQYYKAAY